MSRRARLTLPNLPLLAAALLGTRDPRRGRPRRVRGLHPPQPGEARPPRPGCGLAIFVVSPLRRAGCLPAGLGGGTSGARVECRVALLPECGIRCANSALSGQDIENPLAKIDRGGGALYDPVVAEACLRLFRH